MNKIVAWLTWGAGGLLLNAAGDLLTGLSGWDGWGRFGFAFMGSTVRFWWTNWQGNPEKKTFGQRSQLFLAGIVLAEVLTDVIVELFTGVTWTPPLKNGLTFGIAFAALYVIDKIDKRAKKDKTLDKLGE